MNLNKLIDQSADPPRNRNSNTTFFTPQTAFYPPTTTTTSSTLGGDLFNSNPLLRNVVEQGMKDFAGRTANMLPIGVKFHFFSFVFY